MKFNVKAILLLTPLLVIMALPAVTLAHFGGANLRTVHPESCNHGLIVEESGSHGHDGAMDCSECDDCCSGHVISAELTGLMKINLVLTRFANGKISTSLTSLNFKAPERPPKLLS